MSIQKLAGASNIVFLLAGIYFAALSGLHETTIYVAIPAVLCFIAFGLGLSVDWFFSAPWRTATSVLSIVLLAVQEGADFSNVVANDYFTLASIIVNGAFLILFIGVLLSSVKGSVTREEIEEETGTGEKQLA